MKKIIKYLVGIIAIALIYLLISNFNLIMFKIAIYQQEIVEKISELIEKEEQYEGSFYIETKEITLKQLKSLVAEVEAKDEKYLVAKFH